MKFTMQMEMNVSSEKDLRHWRQLDHVEKVGVQREILGFAEVVGQLITDLVKRPKPAQAEQPAPPSVPGCPEGAPQPEVSP